MAEISSSKEEEEEARGVKEEKTEPALKDNLLPSKLVQTSASKAFAFWAYLAVLVSLLTLLSSLLLFLAPYGTAAGGDRHRRSWFLSLPDDLRHHYSGGKLIKALSSSAAADPIEIFAVEFGPRDGDIVLLLHGLGCSSFSFRRVLRSLGDASLRAVAVDLPGSGFSDRLPENGGRWGGILGGVYDVYSEIKEKGVFWGFDQLVETGGIPYEEIRTGRPRNEGMGTSSRYGPAEMARVLGQVIDSMALAPVHLVLHDSALALGINLVTLNPEFVRSLTLIDPAAELPAFPWGILGAPVIGPLLLRSRFVFSELLRMCCSRSIDKSAAEAHRLLLKGNDGRRAIIEAGKAMNRSFDLGDWVQSEVAKELQLQILWSNMWSDRWIDEAKRAAAAVPTAKFAYHSGGRWPQEDAAEEISNMIVQFVSSFPKLSRETIEESHRQHIEEKFDAESGGHYGHHQHHYSHDHEHAAGYADMYGLGEA